MTECIDMRKGVCLRCREQRAVERPHLFKPASILGSAPAEPMLPAGSSPRRCAFTTGVFLDDNWMCATVMAIRAHLPHLAPMVRAGDDTAALFPWDGDDGPGFVLVTWYKERGHTTGLWWHRDDHGPRAVRLDQAEAIIDMLTARLEAFHVTIPPGRPRVIPKRKEK